MKSKLILKILAIPLIGLLISCGKEKAKDKKVEISHKEIASDTIFDSNNPYYLFIQKNNPEALKDNKLIYFKEEDIDLDGKKEAIVALGEIYKEDERETSISDIFLLKNDQGRIKLIENFTSGPYTVNDVKFVSLKGKKDKYIYLGITNGISMSGFTLLELVNDKIKELCTKESPSGSGSHVLVDNDNDGIYDGCIEYLDLKQTLYYEVEEYSTFKNNKFEPYETHVNIPSEYPKTIEELLLEYISLRTLALENSKEGNTRLKLICKDPNASIIKWNQDTWYLACFNSHMDLDNSIEFKTQEDTYTTTATYIDEDSKQYVCQFELREYDNRWQITKVTILKDGE